MTQPDLSVIIVNYNVRHFLEQCLLSVRKASEGLKVEVFVVDNNSADRSVEMVREKFPEAILIANKTNPGFSRANNQAIRASKGKYVLLLNPDTVVEEDTFSKCISFMNANADAGALGVKMIDGKGNFLPESKRGLPTPSVAFYKIFGLSRLFPNSRMFGGYHLGYLDKEKINKVEVLSGAFMFIRKKVLDEVGLLDEDFFMYGEDIDLSYRITKGGYSNYYFPETRIIHYKGESTKKGSLNYVYVFYKAMSIFAAKHFSSKQAGMFNFLINFAILVRASAAVIFQGFRAALIPFVDAFVIFAGLFILKNSWEGIVKADEGLHFENEVLTVAFPAFILLWVSCLVFSGAYEKPFRMNNLLKGIAASAVLTISTYAMLDESYRFSRAVVLLGSAWAAFSLMGTRIIYGICNIKGYNLDSKHKKILVAGSKAEYDRVVSLIKLSDTRTGFIGRIRVNDADTEDSVGSLSRISEVISIFNADEVVFCAADISSQEIIHQMGLLGSVDLEFKIAPPESLFIIGSNSINGNGDLYVIGVNSIARPINKRNKRTFDLGFSLFLLLTLPAQLLLIRRPQNLLINIWDVLRGAKSWVGYAPTALPVNVLPPIKPGILNPADSFKKVVNDEQHLLNLNQLYAKDYRLSSDISVALKGYSNLSRR